MQINSQTTRAGLLEFIKRARIFIATGSGLACSSPTPFPLSVCAWEALIYFVYAIPLPHGESLTVGTACGRGISVLQATAHGELLQGVWRGEGGGAGRERAKAEIRRPAFACV